MPPYDRYNLEESINKFLIYYNDRKNSTTKVVPFRAIMNVENKDLIYKFKEKTIKKNAYINFIKT